MVAWSILWTVVTTLGAVVSAALTIEAVLDQRTWEKTGHHGRRGFVAVNGVRREVMRLVTQLCLAMIGYMALFQWEWPPVIPVLLFISAAFVLMVNGILDYRERVILRAWHEPTTTE